MIQTGLQSKIKVQELIESQLPNFIFDDSPNAVEFLKQYYISQEYQGGPIDISDNIDEYLKLSNLNDSIIFDDATLTGAINSEDNAIEVSSTKGFPNKYGLLKIDDEIITYTGITTNSFTGCIRGFSGVTNYNQDLNREELVFSTSTASEHSDKSSIQNLSTIFLKDFYKKLKFTFAPGFENISLTKGLDVGNFIRRVRDFYKSKGTEESVRILFKVIFGEDASVVNLENYLIKPSSANYLKREIVVAESISGNPLNIKGQTIFKSTDLNTNASISEIEPFSANGKTYYTLQIYIGNNLESSVQGNFAITPNTKLLESVSVGSSILNVDSTLDFPEFGTLTSGNSLINYTGKTINQFFGCTGVNNIDATSNIISSDTYFSYEDGDTSKKVELILHGKIDNIMQESDEFIVGEGDKFSIKNIGDKINNTGKNWKEIFANSFIYNTTTRYEILDNNNITLSSTIDRSSLKIGDEVEILERNSEISAHSINQSSYIQTIDVNNNSLGLKNTPSLDQNKKYDIRRKLNKANSSGYNFESSSLLSDVINLYTDNDEYAYVASNSFPSEIRSDFRDLNNKVIKNYRFDVESTIKSTSINSISNLSDFDVDKQLYSSITVDSLPFITGDRILYEPESEPLIGLNAGSYYIENIGNQKFKLYKSLSYIESGLCETFFIPLSGVGNDRFILFSQSDEVFGIQKLLKKIPLEKNIKNGSGQNTLPGKTGILINGVEINNYKSEDIIYYGPIEDVNILSSGENYDVINPPLIEVSVGLGSTAKINPVVSGSFEKVYVDSQNYNIDQIVSVDITGGNGSGASIEPILIKRFRDVSFNSNELSLGGGVNVATNQILFLEEHNFFNGEEIVYDPLNNPPIKISVGSTFIDLPRNSSYFAQVDNNKSITLYNSLEDQISKVNPVGIFSGSFGDHKFSTLSLKKQVAFVKVIEGGSNYTNRKLIVKSSGISTIKNTINFKNHGFNDGEIIEYSYDDTQISGITTNNQYKVIKIDNDSFRLSNAGIGGTITSNYERKKYELLESTGTGYQYFKYPDISVSIKYTPVGVGSTTQEYKELITTPVVRGSIIDAYVYESGTGYGSTILNFNKKPIISIKNGNNAEIVPKIVNGKIIDVSINFSDNEYFSVPDLIVSGDGSGAELRAIIDEGKITDVKILSTGIGYSSTNTIIKVISAGNGLIIDPNIRKLTINDNEVRFNGGEVLLKGKDKIQFSVSKYFSQLRSSFLEDGSLSGIIGWAYDGNPIYGPFGYSDPKDKFSEVKQLKPGYKIKASNVEDRPSGFFNGFFVEDYEFNNNGDLDEYNGRYEVNDEFPNGVYAYHATNNTFPYFIGNKYKSEIISDLHLDQSFDFKNSNLLRNTFPYRVSEKNSNYDFIIQSNDIIDQTIEVLSATSGPIESLVVENSGIDYKVGDVINFDETNTSGSGLNVNVSSIKGKDITELNTSSSSYPNSIFTWESSEKVRVSILPIQNLSNNDYVLVSGFSTNLSELNGFHKIEVPEYSQGRCLSTINSSGITTEIYVSPISISNVLSLGSSIGIGTETLKVIGIFENQDIIRVRRGSPGTIHNVGSAVSFFPDSFLISKSVDNFESSLNDRVFFNPKESVGISTINGVGYSTSFVFGNISITREIPSKGIFIEDHPFKTNQSIIYTPNGTNIIVSTDGSSTFNLPSNLFVVSKNSNVIGLKTSISSPELFFHTNGDDDDEYKLESNFVQILGDVDKNVVTVSVSTSHELQNGDTITLDVQPNLSVGIGTSTAVRILYKSEIDNIVVNPIGFNSTGINTTTNEITITNHELETGDKVLYEDSGYNEYFVYKVNDNIIKFCETYFDSQQNPPTVVSFASTGGSSQTISLINPQLQPVKNNNLVFDLSDSSLSGYEFKLYTDEKFNNEFVSTGSTDTFSVSGVGTVGVTSTASLTLNYTTQIPEELFYTLGKDGELVTSDIETKNYSRINFVNSDYNNSYVISEIGETTFNINLQKKPERISYSSEECDILEYSTTSTSPSGPVKNLNILSSGSGYKKFPVIKSTSSSLGKNLKVNLKSSKIGSIKETRIINDNFIYSSDTTLRPKANISPTIKIKNSKTIDNISVINGGNGYISEPNLIIVDSISGNVINSGFIKPILLESSIFSTEVVVKPKGVPDGNVEIISINNSNGISIEKVESSNSGIFTCTISTPINFGSSNFTSQPFSIGDSVFVEGIIKNSSDGDGFNSSDYGYKFFKVSNYDNTGVNDRVTIDISDITTNTGIAQTDQFFTSSIINKNDYPLFDFSLEELNFFVGEKLSSNGIIRDLIVSESNKNDLKVSGLYELSVGEIIVGEDSGTIATIESVNLNNAMFDVKYSYLKNIGWDNDTGKLSENFQVIADNDYYQNLSYSIKSPITYKDQQSPVENLVHISGLKNFADTQIQKNTSAGLSTSTNNISITKNIIDKKYSYTINNFDKVLDVDVNDSKSKFLKFKNTILSDFIELKNTLNVLKIDDISNQFLNFVEQNQEFFTIEQLENETYYNFLLRVTSDNDTKVQLTDVTILSNDKGTFISENESITTSGSTNLNFENDLYGSFDLENDEISENAKLVFKPNDQISLDTKYNIKLIKKTFENTGSTGIQTDRVSIGFIDLIGSEVIEGSSVGIGTTTIISLNSNIFESVYINSQVIDKVTNEMEYVRLYIVHNGVDTFLSEYYSDTSLISSSSSGIGTFYANLDSGILSVSHENNSPNSIEIKSRIVGFGTTSSGIGTYRFEAAGQLFDGSERSAIYDSNYTSTVSAASTTINTIDKNTFNTSKSLVQVSIGSTKALHQIIIAHNGTDVYTQQLPFLSASNNNSLDDFSGIGTFGGEISGDNVIIKFYPDVDKTGQIEIEVLNENLYTELDTVNDYLNLNYGSIVEKVDEKIIKLIKSDFILKNNETPIFSKEFNPNSVALAATTGIFTIKNHFFRTGEELIYTPNSTFFGVGFSSITTPSGGLPSTVYAIKLTEDTFKIATSLTDAQSGIGTTFTSIGVGNAHKFTMKERSSKCIITIDDLIQYPLAYTKIKHDLIGNVGGQVELDTNIISLSGISTIVPNDILLVDDEYMKVVNVGFGTTNLGPITNNGNINLVEVDRGFVGSSASTHLDSSTARVYKGSFNIVDSKIYFSEPLLGNSENLKSELNLSSPKSSFTGRVFLKSNYSSNKIYDDLSDEFTGIGRTFSLRVGGANTTGIGTIGGNGLILVNDSYQSPKTDNNPDISNYIISEDLVSGISSITFSGISNPNNPLDYITSDYDANLNELPRGGIIVSYGSSPGLGFAPLVGASVTSVVGAGGSIVSVGFGTTDNLGSGYNGLVSIGISVYEEGHVGDVASISASIGVGGTLSFNVGSGGTGYTNPKIFVSDPSYKNLPIVGVFRSGIGNTTEAGSGLLVDVELGGSTGIGSTYFEVTDFKFSRSGFNFKKGDIFKPIGLVTDSSLSSPISDFTITVEDVYTDNFSGWEFGELDFLDSIKQLQDGSRTRFPIFYNGELTSFQPESGSEIENNISNLLIIFINGILQEPTVNYQFEGGTSLLFTEAPKPEDVVDIYFYKGVGNIDTEFVDVTSTLKIGDILQVKSSNLYSDISTQDERTIYNIKFSDKLETDKYSGLGINEVKFRPISWTKQKTSKKINGQFTYKTRDSIEPLIFPTSRIIKDISTTDTEIFVDNSELFGYETDTPGFSDDSLPFNAIVINGISTEVSGSIESITGFSNISGFSGIITGITTTTGIGGNSLALKFEIYDSNSTPFSGISTGYPIYIYDTQIGTGVTSIDSSDSAIVGIGTTFLDNIYYISDWSNIDNIGILTCNVKSDSNIIGINTNGNILNPIGKYSWGRLSGGTRSSNPISIGVTGKIVSGLSTYPTIQRRGIGIRKTGALPKIVL
jgi:hypothetical protein